MQLNLPQTGSPSRTPAGRACAAHSRHRGQKDGLSVADRKSQSDRHHGWPPGCPLPLDLGVCAGQEQRRRQSPRTKY